VDGRDPAPGRRRRATAGTIAPFFGPRPAIGSVPLTRRRTPACSGYCRGTRNGQRCGLERVPTMSDRSTGRCRCATESCAAGCRRGTIRSTVGRPSGGSERSRPHYETAQRIPISASEPLPCNMNPSMMRFRIGTIACLCLTFGKVSTMIWGDTELAKWAGNEAKSGQCGSSDPETAARGCTDGPQRWPDGWAMYPSGLSGTDQEGSSRSELLPSAEPQDDEEQRAAQRRSGVESYPERWSATVRADATGKV